jgi:5-methyltetrahydropteroyltriglutamate--homocysteine methyltransferase
MKRSIDRILTTHTGSLPRPDALIQFIHAREQGEDVDATVFAGEVHQAVTDTVQHEVALGIDVISDGEMGKSSFVNYVKDRLTGFGGQSTPFVARDMLDHPDLLQRIGGGGRVRARIPAPACDGPITVKDPTAIHRDIENYQTAIKQAQPEPTEAFLTAASPGVIAQVMHNYYYPSREAYLYALADAMRYEYKAIVDAGLLLQVDCPDLAADRHLLIPDATPEEFRRHIQQNVEVLNYALADIPVEQVRVHVCWGNYSGPHHRDVPLRDIIDLLFQVRCTALSIEAANPRHEHEWKLFESVHLPEGKIVILGLIDTGTNYIEHPELVAQRLVRFARLVGRENVLAGTDCGFGTFAGFAPVVGSIAWAKLRTLVEGAELATRELWA